MRVQIPQAAWDLAAAQSRGKPDPLVIEVALAGTQSASRLPPLTLVFALADLKGAVYYNTYGSLLASAHGLDRRRGHARAAERRQAARGVPERARQPAINASVVTR